MPHPGVPDLPNEVLVEIYRHLPVKDILSMRQVSVLHSVLARERTIWEGMVIFGIVMYYDKNYAGVGRPDGEKVANLRTVTTEEFAWLVCRVRVAQFGDEIRPGLDIYIFRKIIMERKGEEGSEVEGNQGPKLVQLELLNLGDHNLSRVDAQLLASAVVRVKTVVLRKTSLTNDQVNILCRAIVEKKRSVVQLQHLDMFALNLSGVDSRVLAGVVVRLKSINLGYTGLTKDQVTTLCRTIKHEADLALEHLELRYNDTRGVDKQLHDGIMEKVKQVVLQ